MKKVYALICTCFIISCFVPSIAHATAQSVTSVKIPAHVLDISKENTYPNPTQDLPRLQPSKLAQELLQSTNIRMENADLIRLFNESSISKAPLAIGYKATIYLGHWPLNYESTETTVNWEYKKVNVNYADNTDSSRASKVRYSQQTHAVIKGGLTAPIKFEEEIRKMMLRHAMEKTGLPLSFHTAIGVGTKKEHDYTVPGGKTGNLHAYAPAVNEKGKVTFGEVYLVLKGNKKSLQIRNVTSQGIGAWIPVQDHISGRFQAVSP
ncbi:YfkD famly protein [Priestia taiwanensis]|nr:YfkD famly protein [Priestia taiwanensis]